MNKYEYFLHTRTSEKWKKIGIGRRSGVVIPLFSVYSRNSIGIGEIPDIKFIVDWCRECRMSIIQLLPLNDTGDHFAPYNALSTFALEPVYLSLKKLIGVEHKNYFEELTSLRKKFPKKNIKVNYHIKEAKLKLLRKMFDDLGEINDNNLSEFSKNNEAWLKYYSLFKILSSENKNRKWEEWEFTQKYLSPALSEKILLKNENEKNFHYWLQWQLYEQLKEAKEYANSKNVLIMGDLPFLVSRNSADVWAYKNYFKLDLSSGAPPDMYFASGQKWGMPPYDWINIAADNFAYIRQRLKYAENFYDMFRIDHFIGLFRLWTIDLKLPEEYRGLYGRFDPEEEYLWEEHGKKILEVLNGSVEMLPCAEDLGTVPHCSEKVLHEFGIPGINVQRWEKEWRDEIEFKLAEDYRVNSVATVSTHDSSFLPQWWKFEAGTVDEVSFEKLCEKLHLNPNELKEKFFNKECIESGRLYWRSEIKNKYGLLKLIGRNEHEVHEIINIFNSSFNEKEKFLQYIDGANLSVEKISTDFIKRSLHKISSASSIFSIQTIMDWLYLDKNFLAEHSGLNYRINFPGIVSENNWSIRLPYSIGEIRKLKINEEIRRLNKITDRE